MFTRRLAEYLRGLGISGVEFYAESFPAPKTVTPQIVGIFSAGRAKPDKTRVLHNATRRFVVSGNSETCLTKAYEIFELLHPAGITGNKQFEANEYSVHEVFANDDEPHITDNNGNIFFATFVLTFVTSRES